MSVRDTLTRWHAPPRLLAVGALVMALSACADGPLSPSAEAPPVALGAAGDLAPAGAPQVGLCHRTGAGTYVLLAISPRALAAHQAHGDAAPGAAVPDGSGATFDAGCVPQAGGDVTGTYTLQTVNGQPLPALGNDEMLHGATIVLSGDGSCSVRVLTNPMQEDPDGEVLDITFTDCVWVLDGGELTMDMVDERDEALTLRADLSGDTLVIHDDVAGDLLFLKE